MTTDWVLTVSGVLDLDNSIDSLPEGIVFYLHSLPVGNPTHEISSTFMKNQSIFQLTSEFLASKVNLLFFAYYHYLWDIYISVCDCSNRAIIVFFYPIPTPFAMGNGSVDVVERRPE